MRSSTLWPPRGPFPVPARSLFLAAGVCSIGFGAFNLFHERHASQVDNVFVGIACALGAVWLVSLVLGFRGWKPAIVIAGAIAFLEFGWISVTHFTTGAGASAMSPYVTAEGLSLAPALMTLMVLCLLTFMTAVVSWSHPGGRLKRARMLPFVLTSILGATLVILYTTDSVARDNFGTANMEDGTFAASVCATFWLFGGLWIGRVRKTGALLIGLGTFMATFSFTALHIVSGGKTIADIAAKSGPGWAVIAAAMFGLAVVSLVTALAILAVTLARQRRSVPAVAAPAPARRSGSA